MTPALCAAMLKQVDATHEKATKGFFGWFNTGFDALNRGVCSSVQGLVKRIFRLMIIYAILCGFVVLGFMKIPSAFMPPEDDAVRPADTAAERTATNITTHILVIGISFCFMFCRSNIATQNIKNVLKQKNVAKCLNNS